MTATQTAPLADTITAATPLTRRVRRIPVHAPQIPDSPNHSDVAYEVYATKDGGFETVCLMTARFRDGRVGVPHEVRRHASETRDLAMRHGDRWLFPEFRLV